MLPLLSECCFIVYCFDVIKMNAIVNRETQKRQLIKSQGMKKIRKIYVNFDIY